MAQNRDPIYFAVMLARDDDDHVIGHQAYRMERGVPRRKETSTRTLIGEVVDTYQEAAQIARDAHDAELGRPHYAID